jgi:hypothetical protein
MLYWKFLSYKERFVIGRVQKNGPVVQLQISVELEKAIVMRMKIVLGRLNVEAIIALLMTVQVPFFHQQLIVAMIQIQNHVSQFLKIWIISVCKEGFVS